LAQYVTTFRKIAAERAVFFSMYADYEDVPLKI